MSKQFQPGDRVRWGDRPSALVVRAYGTEVVVADPIEVKTVGHRSLVLLSHPLYPKPGEVVVALDADDIATLEACLPEMMGARIQHWVRLNAILDRAREASQ